jgi:hypothetical protein
MCLSFYFMPKLLPQTQAIKDQQFLNALQETSGNATEAAKLVGKIGSQKGKNSQGSAASMGSQRLKKLNVSMVQACLNKGITPDKVADKIMMLLNDPQPNIVDKALSHALKVGVGGGYKPEPITTVSRPIYEVWKDPEMLAAVRQCEHAIKARIARQIQ